MTHTIQRLISKILVAPLLMLGASGLIVTAASADCSLDQSNPVQAGSNCSKNASQPENVTGDNGVFKTITNVLLFLIGAISVIMLIYGGILYTTSGGNSDQVQKAKNTIMYSVVGVIVAILAFAVVNFVITSFANG